VTLSIVEPTPSRDWRAEGSRGRSAWVCASEFLASLTLASVRFRTCSQTVLHAAIPPDGRCRTGFILHSCSHSLLLASTLAVSQLPLAADEVPTVATCASHALDPALVHYRSRAVGSSLRAAHPIATLPLRTVGYRTVVGFSPSLPQACSYGSCSQPGLPAYYPRFTRRRRAAWHDPVDCSVPVLYGHRRQHEYQAYVTTTIARA